MAEGLNIPRDLDLGDRARALHQLGVTPGAHRTLVTRVNETLPERDATLLVSSRQWPVLAHRMHRMAQQNLPFAAHLARIAPDTAAWRTGPPSGTTARLLLAAHHALTTPLDQALPTRPPRLHHRGPLPLQLGAQRGHVALAAPALPPVLAAPGQPALPAHRQQAAPAPRQGRGR
ncbi:hypothetical protein [Streptomyces anulatus]|uniref:hypothetical protein n=1 Tax=Streptomyces anulatus TaxID=1892 RepID=UPI0034480497